MFLLLLLLLSDAHLFANGKRHGPDRLVLVKFFLNFQTRCRRGKRKGRENSQPNVERRDAWRVRVKGRRNKPTSVVVVGARKIAAQFAQPMEGAIGKMCKFNLDNRALCPAIWTFDHEPASERAS